VSPARYNSACGATRVSVGPLGAEMIAILSILIFLVIGAFCVLSGALPKQARSVVVTAVVIITAAAVTYVVTSEALLQRAALVHGGMKGLLMRPTSYGGESTPWAAEIERTVFLRPGLVAASVIIGTSLVAGSTLRRKQQSGSLQVWAAAVALLLLMLAFAVARDISTWDIFI
jgi:hypothetical protein